MNTNTATTSIALALHSITIMRSRVHSPYLIVFHNNTRHATTEHYSENAVKICITPKLAPPQGSDLTLEPEGNNEGIHQVEF